MCEYDVVLSGRRAVVRIADDQSVSVSVFGRKFKQVSSLAEASEYIQSARMPKKKGQGNPCLSSSRFTGGVVPSAVRNAAMVAAR